MGRKNHRFLSIITSIIMISASFFGPMNAHAENKYLELEDVSIMDQSATIIAEDPTIVDNKIIGSITFNELNDYVTYKLSLKNIGSSQIKLTSITDNNTSEYINLKYHYDNNYISTGDTITATITIAYIKQLINQNLTLDNLIISAAYENENGETGEIILVPDTGFFTKTNGKLAIENIIPVAVFVVLMIAGIVLIIIRKKYNLAKIGVILLASATILFPFAVSAEEKFELNLEFTNLEIHGEFEEYEVSINPGGNAEPIIRKITYGETIGELKPAEIDGYDFNKWIDNDGNEVTSETIVTGEMTIEATYIPTTYNILYMLNDGSLPEDQNNPETFTVESDTITLVNPSRLGYTFIGWTGDNGEVPQTTVVIAHGSTGNRNYVANYTPNTDTPYTVTHRYQKSNLSDYDEETRIEHGTTDSTVQAPLSPKHGFVTPEAKDVEIKPDGSAEVQYDYNRDYFDFSITSREDLDAGCVYYSQCTKDGSYVYETPIHIKLKHRDGYHVVWNTGETGDEIDFQLTDDTVLAYEYEPNHYTVKYHKIKDDSEDGITGEVEDQEFIYDQEQALRMNGFEYEGHTFHGWGHGTDWWWSITGEGAVVKNLTGEENGVVDMYASWWLNKYEVEYYDKDADNVLMRRSDIEHGSLAPAPTFTPTKPLYEFAGWYTDDTYTTPYDFETMKVTGPTTIYAKFNYLCGGFENDSWDKIVDDLTANPDLYPMGCKKAIKMDIDDDSEDETVFVKLVNTSTPEVCATPGFSQTACGLVLEFENAIGNHTMNNERGQYSSYGGWKETILATWLNSDFYNKLPEDLKSVIIPTAPIVSSSGSDGVSDNIELTDFDKTYLYIPSGREVGLNLDHDNKKDEATDTRNLDFYSSGSWENKQRRKKTNTAGEEVSWWLRTADFTYNWVYYRIEPSGEYWTGGSDKEYEVVPMFRIGETPEYTIDFNTDGADEIPSQAVQYGGLVTRPAGDPIKEHYDFKGWYADANFEHEFDFNAGIAANQTIYAKFEIIKLDASFNTDGGSSIDTQIVNHGQHVIRPAEDPHKDHYHFVGWYTDGEFDTEFNFEETVITEDVVIYAKFMPDSYTVSFDVDGGNEIPTQTITYPGKASKPTQNPEKENYRFDGWFTDGSFETEFSFSDTIIEQDTTVYAKFTFITHTVNFDTNGGSNIVSQTVGHGQHAARPADSPINGALEFYDWFADEECTIRFDFENAQITDDTTVYAKYKTNFATDDWNTIKNSLVLDSNFYAVGSEKEVELDIDDDGQNESYTVRLANTSTPEVCNNPEYSQTACGYVIEFVDLLGSKQLNNYLHPYIGWGVFTWGEYELDFLPWLNVDFYNKLPADLRNVIIPTYPIVFGESDGYRNTVDIDEIGYNRLYLSSTREVGFDVGNDDAASNINTDTRTLDYYAVNNTNSSRIKKDLSGTTGEWWLRTAKNNKSGDFFTVNITGEYSTSPQTEEKYYAPVFRIGNMPEFDITFNTDGGTAIASQTITYGEKVTKPADPVKDGTLFEDWYADSDYFNKFDFNEAIIENKTVYAYYKDQFGLDSWATIKENVSNNPNYYPVGSRKQVAMDMDNDGKDELYTVRLANTSTPNECRNSTMSQTGCGIVIEFVTIPAFHRMNASDTVSGGWKQSEMITYLNGEFYNKLPEDLRSIIIPTYPIVSGSYKNSTSVDITSEDANKNKLYLLSPREIGADSSGQDTGYNNNRTLDYYTGTSSDIMSVEQKRIKKGLSGEDKTWWLRTVRKESARFYIVYPNSLVQYNFGSDNSEGVAPAFRIAIE